MITPDGPARPSSGSALLLARTFRPSWLEVRGCVLRREAYVPGAFEERWRSTSGNRRSIELATNVVYLRDLVADVDDEILREVGLLLVDMWRAVLAQTFPRRAFDVRMHAEPDERGPSVLATSREPEHQSP